MTADAAVADAFQQEWGRVVATLIRVTGDWDLAEECAQDAFAQALRRWPRDGVPTRPGAWLTTVARNRATDILRRRTTEATKVQEVARLARDEDATPTSSTEDHAIPDDRLRLIFTCCHPALPLEGRVALTLRTLAGLSTAEIARAFLVPEATMAKRLVRAKHKITAARIPYRVPPPELLPARTNGVLAVLYLLFNQGYSDPGDAPRGDRLCEEAIRLARSLVSLLPDEPEALGLLALMLLQHSRRDARVDSAGELVPLDEQDRARWDRSAISEGTSLVDRAFVQAPPGPERPGGGAAWSGGAGPYQLQAAIAATHANARSADETDWAQIAGLYARLAVVLPTTVVELNRVVAVSMADGPAAALALLAPLEADPALSDYYLLPATRADVLRRMGQHPEAAKEYRRALALAPSDAERRFFTRRLGELRGSGPG